MYKGWFGRTARRRCPHTTLEPVYGDAIIFESKGYRLFCLDCWRYIDGPVDLSEFRKGEPKK